MNAIGQALGITPVVTHAYLILDTQNGGNNNIALDTQRQPAKRGRKPKAKVVQSTTQDQSTTSDTLPAPTRTKKSSARGNSKVTPASKTRQPAKSAQKPKQKAVERTTQGKKRTQKQTPVQTRTARKSKASGR